MKIPFLSLAQCHDPLREPLREAFERVLESQWFILGDRVRQFESEYAQFSGVSHCVGVSNGLDALILSLRALNIGAGHEVIVPSNTYIATVLAVTTVGATPIFVEPRADTFNIDVSKLENALTKKTRAIMPVHLYGQCCEMGALVEFASRNKLFVIEDNAQSQGATFDGKLAGSFGHINGTSFYPGKNLGALGDAGAITTNSSELCSQVMALRNYGSHEKYYNDVIGYNMRLDEMQAAFLSVKLAHLAEWNSQRVKLARLYNTALENVGDIRLPSTASGATHVYHLYVIQSDRRDALQQFLQSRGIGTLIHYPVPPHLQKAYASLNFRRGDYPIAESLAHTCLSIPLWPGMNETHVEYVANAISEFF
jgi:dTDP-4-amino-4,6-dideoxygalactose transaminase